MLDDSDAVGCGAGIFSIRVTALEKRGLWFVMKISDSQVAAPHDDDGLVDYALAVANGGAGAVMRHNGLGIVESLHPAPLVSCLGFQYELLDNSDPLALLPQFHFFYFFEGTRLEVRDLDRRYHLGGAEGAMAVSHAGGGVVLGGGTEVGGGQAIGSRA